MNGVLYYDNCCIIEETQKEIQSLFITSKIQHSNPSSASRNYRKFVSDYFIAPSILISLKKFDKAFNHMIPNFEIERTKMSYENAKETYDCINRTISLIEKTLNEIPETGLRWPLNLFKKYLYDILLKLNKLKYLVSDMLFLPIVNQPTLTNKEKTAYDIMNEICGDDDEIYAKRLYKHLTQQIKLNAST
jgi:hypothetical protein